MRLLVYTQSNKSQMFQLEKVSETLCVLSQWSVAACLLVKNVFSVLLQQSTDALNVQLGHSIVLNVLVMSIQRLVFSILGKFGRYV